jgi:hypothetical protein
MRVSDDDPTHRFQIAGLMVFLAGVDKALSLTLELLYLAGDVDWKWMKGHFKVESGEVICSRGLSAKIDKLKELGLDLSALKWLVDSRNRYVHECRIYAGYSFVLSEDQNPKFELRPYGPRFDSVLPPIFGLGPKQIAAYASSLTRYLARFLDKSGWKKSWLAISKKIARLPINPDPEYTVFLKNEKDYSLEECLELVTSLTSQHIGEGLTLVGAGIRKSKATR